jgi:hypothetical protein
MPRKGELAVPTTNPNRDKKQSSERFQTQQKQSGDQHLLPLDDNADAPHRPHRVSREDMQKLQPGQPEQDRDTE